jgi:tetratricopeptide (TPR) repeat protein
MATANELYAEGERQYRQGDFVAAEQAFRRLIKAIPQKDSKLYGRAVYSLALCLLKQARNDEARETLQLALHADPTLDRARERLKTLGRQSQLQTPPRLPSPTTPGGIVGIARRLRQGSEPDPIFGQQRNPFIRFRLETTGGSGMPASPTVEVRGQRIEGSIEDGDAVEIPAPWRPGERPSHVINLTTGETVRGARSGMRTAQWAILITFLVAFAGFAAFVASNMMIRP